jgi:hypothetical protein
MPKVTTSFSLAELIQHTTDELRRVREARSDRDPVMLFEKCELELAVTVKADVGGGIRFWVVDASSKVAGETVSKVKVSFRDHPDFPLPSRRSAR